VNKVNFINKRILGKSGLEAGCLGISSSYGAPAAAFEEAFEKGCNYFTWGTFIRGRSPEMMKAVRNIVASGKREGLIFSMLTYAHNGFLTEHFLRKGLRKLGLDYTDVLLLGYFQKRPSRRLIDNASELKEKGLVRYIGITSHNRKLFPELAGEGIFDIFHLRYNAAHRGAETETFPFIKGEKRPGIVSFTATRWGKLLKSGKIPPGEKALSASECYRFVLSNPSVDVCMMGAASREEMRENLKVLEMEPMDDNELERCRRIGDYVRGKNN
jgi:predicted aldo/keto reductase-like oxidoreductase